MPSETTPIRQTGAQGNRYGAYRVDPTKATEGVPGGQRERKARELEKGAELAREQGFFPDERGYADPVWALSFVVFFCATILAFGIFSTRPKLEASPTEPSTAPAEVTLPFLLGGAASLLGALLYVMLIMYDADSVVWTSLVLFPTLMILGGIATLASSAVHGGLLILVGAVLLLMVFTVWKPFIPFTVSLVRVVAEVIDAHRELLGVVLACTVASIAWVVVVVLVIVFTFQDAALSTNPGAQFGIAFAMFFAVYWGTMVAQNVCHVAYCGVFGRWYFKIESPPPLGQSLGVALGPSFGSICFGSFVLALLRAVQAVLSMARQEAEEEENFVSCCILFVVEMIVQTIGDILEYIGEWAYVQCAVRGTNFVDSATITTSMMTCSNAKYVLSDLLIDSVVNMGTLLCAVIGAIAGALAALSISGNVALGAILGLLAGLITGGAAAGIISSGTKTILALWAENPEPLKQMHPEVQAEFEQRICDKMA